MAATEPIRDKKQLKALADYFLKRGQLRNYTLIVMGTSTALRISDLLRLRWSDVYDELHNTFRTHITIIEKKTKKTKTIALNKQVLQALRLYLPHRRGDFIFVSNRKEGKAISRVQAWRIIHAAVVAVGVEGKISCHSLRKTWGYHAWTSKEISPVVIMHIYNHSNYEVTRRYLGVGTGRSGSSVSEDGVVLTEGLLSRPCVLWKTPAQNVSIFLEHAKSML